MPTYFLGLNNKLICFFYFNPFSLYFWFNYYIFTLLHPDVLEPAWEKVYGLKFELSEKTYLLE